VAQTYRTAAASVWAFLLVGLFVKFAELLWTFEHRRLIPSDDTVARRLGQIGLSLRFSWQEFAIAALLFGLLALWQWGIPEPARWSRRMTVAGRVALGLLSLFSVFGISYYSVYQTHLTVDDLQYVGWAPHLIRSPEILKMSVILGVVWWVTVTFGFPRAAQRAWPRYTAGHSLVTTLIVSACAVITFVVGRPNLAEARLVENPVAWMLFGKRMEYTDLPPMESVAPTGPRQRALAVSERPRNIILVALESTPALAVSAYQPGAEGGRRMFEVFGNDITLFTDVFGVAPNSTAGLVSVLVGRTPIPSASAALAAAGTTPTLAEALKSRGFQTQFLFNGPTDQVRTALRSRGFDRALMLDGPWPGADNYGRMTWGYDDRLLFDTGRAFLETQTKDSPPFFLMLHSNNTHHPYTVDHLPGGGRAVDEKARHRLLVNHTLELVTDLYAWLRQSGLADSTAVLVYGDHGEAFGEHEGNFIHSKELYAENVHVPMWLMHPRRLGLPSRITQLGSLDDVAPTVLDILGVDSGDRQGMSLLFEAPSRLVVSMTEWGPGQLALRDQRYVYVLSRTGRELLFDRVADPMEQTNLVTVHPDIAAGFRARFAGR
jgi:glucan phosphoethanolaminetransferase (alkaline phosphatase superfamily)